MLAQRSDDGRWQRGDATRAGRLRLYKPPLAARPREARRPSSAAGLAPYPPPAHRDVERRSQDGAMMGSAARRDATGQRLVSHPLHVGWRELREANPTERRDQGEPHDLPVALERGRT